jgi:NAD(P)H-dependent FMN reductase
MAENILIISSTSGNNFTLAKTLNDKLETFNISPKILNLEDFELPLFKPGVKASSATIEKLTQHFVKADGFIFCSPEYNGGLTPILTNAITWI